MYYVNVLMDTISKICKTVTLINHLWDIQKETELT